MRIFCLAMKCSLLLSPNLKSDILRGNFPMTAASTMTKGPGVSATSRIIASSQTNVHNYIKNRMAKQQFFGRPGGRAGESGRPGPAARRGGPATGPQKTGKPG